jgi:hypothetical protein
VQAHLQHKGKKLTNHECNKCKRRNERMKIQCVLCLLFSKRVEDSHPLWISCFGHLAYRRQGFLRTFTVQTSTILTDGLILQSSLEEAEIV